MGCKRGEQVSEQKPKCPKCGFTNLAVERRPNGDAKCSYCKWMGAYIECFKTMNEEKPREFWLCDNTDNSGWSVDTEYSHKNHFGSVNVFHVIEKSAYDALAERLREAEAALGFSGNRAIEYFEKWGNK